MVALLLAMVAQAQQVTLSVEPRDLVVGQTAQMRVLVTDAQASGIPDVAVPDPLRVAYTGQQTSVRSTLGRGFTRTIAFNYGIQVPAEGTFTIGPATVEARTRRGTQQFKTNAVTIKVRERPADAGGPRIEARANFDTEDAWEGQVVLYHYDLRSRVRLVDSPNWKLPAFDGLRSPREGSPWHNDYLISDPDGDIHVYEGDIPLIATGTGTRDQPAALVQVAIADGKAQRRGPWAMMPSFKRHALATDRAQLTVRPLPPAPDGFTGLVGEFSVVSQVDRRMLRVGESARWVLTMTGDGSLEGLAMPDVDAPGARIYDSGGRVSAKVFNGRYAAAGQFERVIVATEEGTLDPPPIDLVTFSPKKGDYVTHTIDLQPIRVVAGGETIADIESFAGGDELLDEPLPEIYELRPIHGWGLASVWYLGGILPFFMALAAVPGLGVVGLELAAAGRRQLRRLRSRRTAPPRGSRLLRQLPSDPEARLAAQDAALRQALANHAGVSVAQLDRAEVIATLPQELATRVRTLGETLDRARFAGLDASIDDEVAAVVKALEAL